ncbi:MAG: hypothetical protein OXT74_06925 [Candidatus Poribacteria bacterium]|nr:hypothetical protein [Candidatus Poribacteria bacterium]
MRPHTLTSYDTVEVIVRARSGGLTWGETAELIGVDERTLHYWRAKGKSLWIKIYTWEMQETELSERERWLVDLYERLNRPDDDPDAIFYQLEARLDEKQAELNRRAVDRESKRLERRQRRRAQRQTAPQPDLNALLKTAEKLERMAETQRSNLQNEL